MSEIITIFCPFTRWWATERWIEDLKKVDHDPSLVNLCFIVDGDQGLIANTLTRFANENNYRSIQTKVNHDWSTNEVQINIRRARIAEVKNQSKEMVSKTDGKYIIGLEDDTEFSRLRSFDQLIQPIIDDPNVGFVEGVQMGRWGANVIGAWKADNIDDPNEVQTILPRDGLQEITGGGWYGYATTRELYLNCEYYSASSEPYGPDVNFGFYVRRRGFKCLIYWDLVFGHRDFNKVLYPEDHKLIEVVYNKDRNTGKWNRTDKG